MSMVMCLLEIMPLVIYLSLDKLGFDFQIIPIEIITGV